MPRVTLYGKPGCHLCEEALTVVESLRPEYEFELVEVDVTLDPRLYRSHGERIPVLEVDGMEAFQYRVDRARLGALLAGTPGSAR